MIADRKLDDLKEEAAKAEATTKKNADAALAVDIGRGLRT